MIKAAVKALADKKGSSRQAILKYICANYKVDAAAGKKGAGSFKLPAKEPKAKKPAAKKPKAKKAAKKPAAKKPKAAKKPAAKKPKAAKPAAKKPAAKKA